MEFLCELMPACRVSLSRRQPGHSLPECLETLAGFPWNQDSLCRVGIKNVVLNYKLIREGAQED